MPPRRGSRVRRPTTCVAETSGNVPPVTPEVQNFFQNLVQTIIQSAQTAIGTAQAPDTRNQATIRNFQQQHPPKFHGTEGPIDAENWIDNLTQIFKLLKVTDEEDRILLASSQLVNDAGKWWKMVEEEELLTDRTWKGFKELFLGRYFLEEEREAKVQEFIFLAQRNMSVADYQVEFTRLSTYAPYMVDTESKKTRKFERGLRPAIKSRVISPAAKTYAEIVSRAITIEKDLAESASFMEHKRKQGSASSSQSHKRFRSSASHPSTSAFVVQSTSSVFTCFHCGQAGHTKRNCPQLSRTQATHSFGGTFSCYQCGQSDHIRRNCPQLRQGPPARASYRPPGRPSQSHMSRSLTQPRQTPVPTTSGRVYSIVPAPETVHQSGVRGMTIIGGSCVVALFASGVSHSFLSASIVSATGILVQHLSSALNIISPVGDTSLGLICTSVDTELTDFKFKFDYLVMDMAEYDVIFGMDWLSTYQACIDCHRRRVTFWSPEGQRFIVNGDTQKMSMCGEPQDEIGQILLNSLRLEDSRISTLPAVVKDYADVFPTELPEFLGSGSRPNTFSYTELKNATEGFIATNKLGEGGFGPVYKGTLTDGRIVAVKQLSVASHQGKDQFIAEISAISGVRQWNLVKLYGCCIEGDKRLLVYEYLENKSLDQALFGKSNLHLDWPTRFKICLGTGRGLAYLHEESRPQIVHRDVKASNILLDADLNPKISDFGLAKIYDDKLTHISTIVAGTIGYLAPEYAMRGHLTEKADVFAFGVLALEIVSGRPNSSMSVDLEKIHLLEWAWHLYENNRALELVDQTLSKFDEGEALRMIHVALLCIQASPTLRPPMSRVVAMLLGDIEVCTVTAKPGYLADLP